MVELNRPVDKLTLKIYTKAMVAIYSLSSGPQNTGWAKVPLPTEFVKSAESGTYYYTITAEKNGSTSRLNGTGHIVVIR